MAGSLHTYGQTSGDVFTYCVLQIGDELTSILVCGVMADCGVVATWLDCEELRGSVRSWNWVVVWLFGSVVGFPPKLVTPYPQRDLDESS